jgi:hypothetical protein
MVGVSRPSNLESLVAERALHARMHAYLDLGHALS